MKEVKEEREKEREMPSIRSISGLPVAVRSGSYLDTVLLLNCVVMRSLRRNMIPRDVEKFDMFRFGCIPSGGATPAGSGLPAKMLPFFALLSFAVHFCVGVWLLVTGYSIGIDFLLSAVLTAGLSLGQWILWRPFFSLKPHLHNLPSTATIGVLCCIVAAISVAAFLLRLFLVPTRVPLLLGVVGPWSFGEVVAVVVLQILPFTAQGITFLGALVHCWTAARLLHVCQAFTDVRRGKGDEAPLAETVEPPDSEPAEGRDHPEDEDELAVLRREQAAVHIDPRLERATLWKLMRGEANLARMCLHLPRDLAQVTLLCFTDDDHPLCEHTPVVERVALPTWRTSSTSEEIPAGAADHAAHPSTPPVAALPPPAVELELQRDPTEGLRFTDDTWRLHFESLRPFCLDAYLLGFRHSQLAADPLGGCLPCLGRVAGFAPDRIFSYVPRAELYTRFPAGFRRGQGDADGGRIASLVLEQTGIDTLQMVNMGTPGVLIDSSKEFWNGQQISFTALFMDLLCVTLCARRAEFWNGQQICPLTEAHRARLRQCWTRWVDTNLACVALAYNPIPHRHCQIFLGLAGIRMYPIRRDAVRLVDRLSQAGIRFVYFCSERESRAKDLGASLGINMDWNSTLSLRPSQQPPVSTTNNTFPSSVHTSALDPLNTDPNLAGAASVLEDPFDRPTVLPRGIAQIREQLVTRDDVPLRVPFFCDATQNSISEMLSIYRDYGETVCAVAPRLIGAEHVSFVTTPLAERHRAASGAPPRPTSMALVAPPTRKFSFSQSLNQTDIVALRQNLRCSLGPALPSLRSCCPTPDVTPCPTPPSSLYATAPSPSAASPAPSPKGAAAAPPSVLPGVGILPTCSIRLATASLDRFVHMFIEARRLRTNGLQAVRLTFEHLCTLVLLNTLAVLLGLPPALGPVHVVIQSCIYAPLLSLSMLASPLDPKDCRRIAAKRRGTLVPHDGRDPNDSDDEGLCWGNPGRCFATRATIGRLLVLVGPTVILLVAIHAWGLYVMWEPVAAPLFYTLPDPLLTSDPALLGHWALVVRTSFALRDNLVMFVVHSASALAPTSSFRDAPPCHNMPWIWMSIVWSVPSHPSPDTNTHNMPWIWMSIVCLVAQLSWSVASTLITVYLTLPGIRSAARPTFLTWPIYVVAFVWPLAILLIDGAAKWSVRRRDAKQQKRRLIDFETKLGLNSPL
ncbi:putative transmembrane protein 94 [Paratrimastix pyriformis]|uniref:Transmembrane protein 94 n=1 Tax=Paratrimastix pyriformis TaxID=342808 RepID=A0ABQ8UCV8_9EUKA|nr:putative transmembrane protein 94 [Paratrimastix pyriformis]